MPKRRGKYKAKETEALVKNAADEKQVERAKIVAKHTREVELDDLRAIMNTPMGQRFLGRYVRILGVLQTGIGGDFDTNKTFALAGQREAGLQLLSDMLESDSEICASILLEAKEGK